MKSFFLKTLMLSAFLIGIAFRVDAQGTKVNLMVTTIDGVEQTYHLTEESQLHFENGQTLVIEDGNNTIRFELANIRKIVCSEVVGTTENSAPQLQILPNPTRNSFIIRNLNDTCIARIYSLDGRLVKTIQASEGMVVDMSELSQGMYLLNVNGQTLKLMKL